MSVIKLGREMYPTIRNLSGLHTNMWSFNNSRFTDTVRTSASHAQISCQLHTREQELKESKKWYQNDIGYKVQLKLGTEALMGFRPCDYSPAQSRSEESLLSLAMIIV